MTRLFRNPNIKVGDKVRIHAKPVHPLRTLSIAPEPDEVGLVVVVTAVSIYDEAVSLDYDVNYRLENGAYRLCDSQFLEIV